MSERERDREVKIERERGGKEGGEGE